MAATADESAQLAERYPNMIAADSSSLSVIITMRLNSKEEIYRYKVEIVGSTPTVATTLVRNSTGLEYQSFTLGVVSSPERFRDHRAN